jgi:hypothetical protein
VQGIVAKIGKNESAEIKGSGKHNPTPFLLSK